MSLFGPQLANLQPTHWHVDKVFTHKVCVRFRTTTSDLDHSCLLVGGTDRFPTLVSVSGRHRSISDSCVHFWTVTGLRFWTPESVSER